MAIPVCLTSHKSAMVPPKFAMVTDEKRPDKNRRTRKPPRFCTRAVPSKKRRKHPYGMMYSGVRPKYCLPLVVSNKAI